MRDASNRRLQLKSRLLIGATGLFAAAMGNAASAADATPPTAPEPTTPVPATSSAPIPPQKWLPYADIGGGVGNGFTVGRIDTFTPVWQDLDSLAFVRIGVDTRTNYSENFNVGLGYRTKIDGDWLLGAFGGFDSSQTDYDHAFNQFSFGAEAMSADWDIRVNGYAAQTENKAIYDKYALYVHDTSIAILQAQEAALSGFDGEVGYRIFNTDTTDVRVFAGGYSFHHDAAKTISTGQAFDLNYHDVAGPKVRAEVNVFDLDMIGPQSRLSIDAEVSHDDVYHTSGYIGATLRIPLNNPSGPGAQALDDLDRRMADPVRRNDNVLTQWQFNKPEPVIIYNGAVRSQPTNTVYYAEQRAGTGAGSYADPTTIKDATARGPKNQFVVLTSFGGPIDTNGATIQSGETVTAGGPTPFTIRGVNSNKTFTHEFAPASGAVTLTSTGANVIALGTNSTLANVTISGPFTTAIYGNNVSDVNIADVTINGGGTAANGVVIKQDAAGSASVDISHTTITGVTGDGVQLNLADTGAGTSNVSLNISNSTISAGTHGVNVMTAAAGGANSTVYAGIHNSTITSAGTAVSMTGTVAAGSTLNQTLVVDPTVLTGGQFGIFVDGYAGGGTLNQTVTVDDVTVNGAAKAGIYIDAHAAHGATVNQDVTIGTVTVHGSTHLVSETQYYNGNAYTYTYTAGTTGIEIFAQAGSAGTVNQTASLSNISVTGGFEGISLLADAENGGKIDQGISLKDAKIAGSYSHNILAYGYAEYGSTVHQDLSLTNVSSTGSISGDGLLVIEDAIDGSTAIQHINIDGFVATGNADNGVTLTSFADNYTAGDSSVAAQYVSIANANISDNGANGVEAVVYGFHDSVARQDLSITNSTLAGNGYDGLRAYAYAGESGAVQQNIYLAHVTADDNTAGGIAIVAGAGGGGFAEQTALVYYSEFNSNGGEGIYVRGAAYSGGDVEQNVTLYFDTADNNGGDGLGISAASSGYSIGSYAAYFPHVQQNIIVGYSDFSHNQRNGIYVKNYAGYGGILNQLIDVYSSHMDGNGASGFRENSIADAFGFGGYSLEPKLYSDIYIINSTAKSNGGNGIEVDSSAIGPTYLIQTVYVAGSEASHNTYAGFVNSASAFGYYSFNEQNITLAGSKFDNNGTDGAQFFAYQYYGPQSFGAVIQNVTISNSKFTHNAGDGLYANAEATAYQGRAEQHFTIQNSKFDYNGHDGAEFYNFAHNGVYVPPVYNPATYVYNGGPCTNVVGLAGGCAFVRQTVQISGSDFSYNSNDGISITSHADTYGAVYNSSGRPAKTPTLLMKYSTANNNGGDGLHVSNTASNNSYIYSYAVLLGSQFNGNGRHGIELTNSALSGSVIAAKAVLYGVAGYATTADGNAGDGVHVSTSANDGYVSQVLYLVNSDLSGNQGSGLSVNNTLSGGGLARQSIVIADSTINDNHGDGVHAYSYVTGGSTLVQSIAMYSYAAQAMANGNGLSGLYVAAVAADGGNVSTEVLAQDIEASGNLGSGISLVNVTADPSATSAGSLKAYYNAFDTNVAGLNGYTSGAGAYQYNYASHNTFAANQDGVMGVAKNGSFQYWDVSGGNTHTGDAHNYSFTYDPASLIAVNY